MPLSCASRSTFNGLVEKCEGATGSLAIVAPDHGPSHPRGVTPRIAIASDAPREPQVGARYLVSLGRWALHVNVWRVSYSE